MSVSAVSLTLTLCGGLKILKKEGKKYKKKFKAFSSCFLLGDDNSKDSDHCLQMLSMLVLTSCAVLFLSLFLFLFSKKKKPSGMLLNYVAVLLPHHGPCETVEDVRSALWSNVCLCISTHL